jgi:AraC-like DNA-binding protein
MFSIVYPNNEAVYLKPGAQIISMSYHGASSIEIDSSQIPRFMTDSLRSCEQFSAADLLDRSPDDLACELGCSRVEFNRLIRDHFGLSLVALKIELRLLQAAHRLRKQPVDVSAIAGQCGFGNIHLFAACFEKRFGTTPSKWSEQSDKRADVVSRVPRLRKLLVAFEG